MENRRTRKALGKCFPFLEDKLRREMNIKRFLISALVRRSIKDGHFGAFGLCE